MQMKRNQHYLPKFYLKHFAMPNGQLWCYRRNAKRFMSNIDDTCRQRDLHEARSSDSRRPNGFVNQNYIENALSEKENQLTGDYEFLLECCACRDFSSPHFQKALTTISQLPGFFIERQPYSIENYRKVSKELAENIIKKGSFSEGDLSLCKKQGYENELPAMIHHYIMQETIINSDEESLPVHQFSKALQALSFYVIEAPAAVQFITCSCPLCLSLKTHDYTKVQQVVFPLSSKYCAVFVREQEPRQKLYMVTRNHVATINQQLLLNAPLWTTAISRSELPLAKAQAAYELSGCPASSVFLRSSS